MADTAGGTGHALQDVRVRAFIDFWNFQLNIQDWDKEFRLDWRKLGPWLAAKAGETFLAAGQAGRVRYDGLHVYLSHDPRKSKDDTFRRWAMNVLNRFPGVIVTMQERRPKHAPDCPVCHARVEKCPKCQASMVGTIEKGIDTAIVTDMIRLAWEDSWDLAVLVSADRDFIPAVEYLGQKGHKVVHAAFPPWGMDLSTKCWASFDVRQSLREVGRTV